LVSDGGAEYSDTECDLASNVGTERDQAGDGGTVHGNAQCDVAGKPDGVEHDLGMGDGCAAQGNTDGQPNGDGYVERDPISQRDEHGDVTADEHAGGCLDALADADAATCGEFSDGHSHTDAALKVSSVADVDEHAGVFVPNLFAFADTGAIEEGGSRTALTNRRTGNRCYLL